MNATFVCGLWWGMVGILLTSSPRLLRAQAPVQPAHVPVHCPAPDGSEASLQQLMRAAVEVQKVQDQAESQFAWHEREITREWDHGKAVRTEDKTWDVSTVGGEEYRRLIARNGQPLPPEEALKEQKKEEDFIRKHEPKNAEERAKVEKKLREEQAKDEKRNQAVLTGFQYSLVGRESTSWGSAWVLHAEPRPDFHPQDKDLKILTHFTGDLWIEQQGCHAVRLRLQIREPISFGWILGKLDQGGVVNLEFAPISPGNWFLHQVRLRAQGRILFKHLNVTSQLSYSDFRRFGVSSRILPATALKR